MNSLDLQIELLPRQMQFMRSTSPDLLYSGAAGAGKSYVLCCKARDYALTPGALVGLFRKRRTDLRATTLRTLIKGSGDLPPVLPEGSYEHLKNESLIHIYGGGEIWYGGVDNETTIGSLDLSAAMVDEAVEIDEDEWDMLQTRLRNPVGPPHQIAAATNPGTPSHFLYKRFFKDPSDATEVIQTKTTDNFFLPKDYIERLERLTGTAYQRLVLGRWVAHKGLIFGDITSAPAPEAGSEPIWVVGVDAGYRHPHAVLICIPDGPEGPHARAETRLSDTGMGEFIAAIDSMCAGFDVEPEQTSAWVDPSAPELIDKMLGAGYGAGGAPNDVLAGISTVLESGVTLDPESVPELTRECHSYRWNDKAQTERPIKEDDHGPDALRYGLHGHALYGDADFSISV